jgi:hypothetical protein
VYQLVPHLQSSIALLTQVLGVFSCEIRTILWINVIVFTFKYQASITMADIKLKYQSKNFPRCVIFRFKILQKTRIFPKWALWMRHLALGKWLLICNKLLSLVGRQAFWGKYFLIWWVLHLDLIRGGFCKSWAPDVKG